MFDAPVGEDHLGHPQVQRFACTKHLLLHPSFGEGQGLFQPGLGQVCDQRAFIREVAQQTGHIGQDHQLFGLHRTRDIGRGPVGIHVQAFAFWRDRQRRNHRRISHLDQRLEQFAVHRFDFAGEIITQNALAPVIHDADRILTPGYH